MAAGKLQVSRHTSFNKMQVPYPILEMQVNIAYFVYLQVHLIGYLYLDRVQIASNFNNVSRVFQGCFKDVSRTFQFMNVLASTSTLLFVLGQSTNSFILELKRP